MKKLFVKEFLDSSVPMDCRRIGIEIEVEKAIKSEVRYWVTKSDESLRDGGCEFISHPIPLADVKFVLDDFYHSFNKFKYAANRRTGIHVHVDARDFTLENIQSLAATYALIEPGLFTYVGAEREENIYCVPWYRADNDVVKIGKLFNQYATLSQILPAIRRQVCKYSGLYLEPLGRFGTAEFRHAPTWKDLETTLRWVKMCYATVEFAKNNPPETLMRLWELWGPRHFFLRATNANYVPPPDYEETIKEADVSILAEYILGRPKVEAQPTWRRQKEPEKKVTNKLKSPKPMPGLSSIDLAVYHGLGSGPIPQWASTDASTTTGPDDPSSDLIVIEDDWAPMDQPDDWAPMDQPLEP